MHPRTVRLTRAVFTVLFLVIGSYLLWAAAAGQLTLPELAAGAIGELALGAFVLFGWPWAANRTLNYGLLAVMWAAVGAGALIQNQGPVLAALCGAVALNYVMSCFFDRKTEATALSASGVDDPAALRFISESLRPVQAEGRQVFREPIAGD